MSETVAPDPTPEQAALMARVRRLMLVAGLTTALGIGAVLIAVGYRLFHSGETAPAEAVADLPVGARIVSTVAAGDRLAVTIELPTGGAEIRTFDARSLKPVGRLKFDNGL
jgi:hypothetical protein